MDPLLAAVALAGLVAVSALVGLLWRARDGRVRVAKEPASAGGYRTADFDGTVSFADRATLVQFSTEYCSRCPATERMLRSIASAHHGVGVAVVDLTARRHLATRFRVAQTPTVLVLDGDGRELARSAGAPQRAAIEAVLTTLTRSSHVAH
jgi:thioredoxin-like negative regulator of GroEL